MILSPQPCPDCDGTGINQKRGGLCDGCHGSGKRRPTPAEEAARADASLLCPCGAVTGPCNGGCGVYI